MQRLVRRIVLCCIFLVVALPAWAAPSVEMTVQPANEGRVRQGGWVTVVVDLANRGGEFRGELVVEADTDAPHPQYVVPFTMPAGGRKRIPVSLETTGNAPIAVRLFADGQPVQNKQVTLTWLPPRATLVGVLSGDELGILGLSHLQGADAQADQVVRLSADTFPDRAALLEDFDVIALSRFDASALSPTQLRALEVWVGRGGTLLLFGGPEWKRTLAALPPSLVPVAVTGVRELPLDPLGEFAGRPLSATGVVSVATLKHGQVMVEEGGVPLIASAAVGSGRVLYLAFDPGLNPVVAWPGQTALFNRLLGGAVRTAREWPGQHDWMLREALRQLPEWALPSLWTVSLLLVSYLLLVGPVNYLVLKRLDKRDWGWVSIPALSVLFLAVVYLLGFSRFQSVVSHLITVTELVPGAGAATMTSYLGLYAPGMSRLSVDLGEARLVRPLFASPGRDLITARIASGERTTVELLNLSGYQMSELRMEHDIPVQGGLELVEGRLEGGILTGRLRNALTVPVDGIRLISGADSTIVGRLEPGELSAPFRLSLNGGLPGFPLPGGAFRGSAGVALPEESGPGAHRRQRMMDYVLQSTLPRLGGSVLVTGWTDQPLAAVNLPGPGKLVLGANLVYALLPVPVGGAAAEVPPGVILGRPADPKAVEWLPNGYLLRPGTHTFTLPLPPLLPERVGAVEIDLRMLVTPDGLLGGPGTPIGPGGVAVTPGKPISPGDLAVSVKNQRTGEWLPMTGQIMALPDWQAFISPAGLIELRYEAKTYIEIQPPTVAVKGVAR